VEEPLDQLLNFRGGVATAAQLLNFMSKRQLAFKLKTGQLQRVWYGVYARPDPDTETRLRALDILTGTRVAVCLGTAAALHGFDTEHTRYLHVLNPPGHHLRTAAGILVHRRVDTPLVVLDNRRVSAPTWCAVEVACSLPRPRALATLDAALRSGACTPTGLAQAAARQAGRRGIVAVRALLPLASSLAESPMESEARLAMHDGELPEPVLQHHIVDRSGRVWRVDFAWPQHRVAVEYDSDEWHGTAEAMRRDRDRREALRDAGWHVITIFSDDVRRNPRQLAWRIRAELLAAAA
jgi:hypothetical protein